MPVICALFGGTFDPIHNGHVSAIEQVHSKLAVDQIRLLPAAIPPHRAPTQASASARYAMAQLALANNPQIIVDDRELKRSTPSFTIDTVLELQEQFTEHQFVLILGVDAALNLPSWQRADELLEQVAIVVLNRPGWPLPTPLPEWWLSRQAHNGAELNSAASLKQGTIATLDITPYDISASALRRALTSGDMDYAKRHLNSAVWQYIVDHHLYMTTENPSSSELPENQQRQRTTSKNSIEAEQMRDLALAALEDAKGENISVLDVRELTDITDYMLIATGTSDRHCKSLSSRVLEHLHEAGWRHHGVEGETDREWILVDFVDIVIHVMRHDTRQHYDLESLWDPNLAMALRQQEHENESAQD